MFLKNCWYVAAWDHEILADTLLARTILGQSVLIYRKADGTPVAFDRRRFTCDFKVPGVLLMTTHVTPAERDDDDMTGALQFHSCQALTPETDTSTHYFFMQAHNFRLDDVTVTDSIYQSLCTAFEEDRRIIEAQQRLINASAPVPMQPIAADLALAQYRRVLQELVDAERASVVHGPEPQAGRKGETNVPPA